MRYKNFSSSLEGIDSSKDVEKALLEVSAKIGEAKKLKEARIFPAQRVLIVTKNLLSCMAQFQIKGGGMVQGVTKLIITFFLLFVT